MLRRLLQAALVLLLLVTATFAAVRALPGGPATFLANPEYLSPEIQAQIERNLGLDQPLPVQYAAYLTALARGDLGWSYSQNAPVGRIIGERFGPTLLLLVATFAIAGLGGTALGGAAALAAGNVIGRALGLLAVVAVTVPAFWLGLILLYLLAIDRPLLPSGGLLTAGAAFDAVDLARHLVLPAVTLAVSWLGAFALFSRSSLLTVLTADYVRTARAKGLTQQSLLLFHALPNAAIPLITLAGLSIPHLLAGSVVVERIFSWPGIGRLMLEALLRRDYPVILGIVLLVGVVVVVANLVTDLLYHAVNPEVRPE